MIQDSEKIIYISNEIYKDLTNWDTCNYGLICKSKLDIAIRLLLKLRILNVNMYRNHNIGSIVHELFMNRIVKIATRRIECKSDTDTRECSIYALLSSDNRVGNH